MKQIRLQYHIVALKVATIWLSVPAIVVVGVLLYHIITGLENGPALWVFYPLYGLIMISSIVYLMTFIPAYKLIIQYQNDEVFEDPSIHFVKQMMIRFFIITVVQILQLPFWFIIAELDDAPGLILVVSYITGISGTVTIILRVIQDVMRRQKEITT